MDYSSTESELYKNKLKELQTKPQFVLLSSIFAAAFIGCTAILYAALHIHNREGYSVGILAVMAFLASAYAWFFFSQILIFVPSGVLDGFFSLLLMFALIATPVAFAGYLSPFNPPDRSGEFTAAVSKWPTFALAVGLAWLLACVAIWFALRSWNKKEKLVHPLTQASKMWSFLTLTFLIASALGNYIIGPHIVGNWSKFIANPWTIIVFAIFPGTNSIIKLTTSTKGYKKELNEFLKDNPQLQAN